MGYGRMVWNGRHNCVFSLCALELSCVNFFGFPGAKVVFWDMRDSFLSYLYYGGVEGNRIEAVLPQFDKVRFVPP